MNDIISISWWLAEWALFVYKYLALRRAPREHKPLIRPVAAAAFFTGTAFMFNAPSIGVAFDRLTGVPNLAMLIEYIFMAATLCSLRIMFLLWRHTRERLWWKIFWPVLAYGLIIATMTALFFMGSTVAEHHTDFAAAFGRTPYIAELLILFFITLMYGMADAAVLYWRWTGTTPVDQPWLRRGLRLSAFAFVLAVGYGVINLVAVVASWFVDVPEYWTAEVAPNVGGAGVPVAVVGLSIAAWGPRMTSLRARVVRYRADHRDYRQLSPLWEALTAVDPAMIHQPSSWRERVSLESRLFWRVIEINDWLHQLRAYRDPAIARIVERRGGDLGLTADDIGAAVEAAQIVAAVAARAKGERAQPSSVEAVLHDTPGETKHAFGAERARLVMTARVLTSPLVIDAVESVRVGSQEGAELSS